VGIEPTRGVLTDLLSTAGALPYHLANEPSKISIANDPAFVKLQSCLMLLLHSATYTA
jgi:hypothetical protein